MTVEREQKVPVCGIYMVRNCIYAIILLIVLHWLHCTYPTISDDNDIRELERVWQYCSALSIYQERVMNHKQALQSPGPQEIIDALEDTMHSPWLDSSYQIAQYYYDASVMYRYLNAQSPIASTQQENDATVKSILLSPNILYIKILSFGYQTHLEMSNSEIAYENVEHVIIDLINNPGGNLESCTSMVELFLPANTHYLDVQMRRDVRIGVGTGTVVHEWVTNRTGDIFENKKVTVLVNHYSASAAEILLAALKDHLPAESIRVLGKNTYGKGIGQYVFPLVSGGGLILTGFKLFRTVPTLRNYHEKGIEVDVVYNTNLSTLRNVEDAVRDAIRYWDPSFNGTINLAKKILSKERLTESALTPIHPRGYLLIENPDLLLDVVH